MAAENRAPTSAHGRRRTSFNEAAAHGRGKRADRGRTFGLTARFNEAAAHGRGKLPAGDPAAAAGSGVLQ